MIPNDCTQRTATSLTYVTATLSQRLLWSLSNSLTFTSVIVANSSPLNIWFSFIQSGFTYVYSINQYGARLGYITSGLIWYGPVRAGSAAYIVPFPTYNSFTIKKYRNGDISSRPVDFAINNPARPIVLMEALTESYTERLVVVQGPPYYVTVINVSGPAASVKGALVYGSMNVNAVVLLDAAVFIVDLSTRVLTRYNVTSWTRQTAYMAVPVSSSSWAAAMGAHVFAMSSHDAFFVDPRDMRIVSRYSTQSDLLAAVWNDAVGRGSGASRGSVVLGDFSGTVVSLLDPSHSKKEIFAPTMNYLADEVLTPFGLYLYHCQSPLKNCEMQAYSTSTGMLLWYTANVPSGSHTQMAVRSTNIYLVASSGWLSFYEASSGTKFASVLLEECEGANATFIDTAFGQVVHCNGNRMYWCVTDNV